MARRTPILTLALLGLTVLQTSLAQRANTWQIVGETGASAQQLFLGTENKVYIVDKVQGNAAQVMGAGGVMHPAWATEYDLTTNTYRALDIVTNSFCAGGSVMGDGTWLNAGGNQAITTGGVDMQTLGLAQGEGAYNAYNGGRAIRLIKPCNDETCVWTDQDAMPLNRWYPTLETIEDGSVAIFGGELWGGFVNSPGQLQNVPTYEYWPTRGAPITMTFLEDTQPANLYPLTWLLPNGLIFMQADWQTTLLNHTTNEETRLPNITKAQKTYPASGGTTMLPLTVANNWEPTILFCGGMNPERDDWDQLLWAVVETDTSNSCVSIKPQDANPTWVDDDDLPENRGMGSLILLPDERVFISNGASKGSAGYGWDAWAQGQSYAQDPVLRPAIYNGSAPSGSRWSSLPPSTIARMYHSSSTLLPDGSVFVAGSSPSADVITEANNASYPFKTEYRAEIFYPDYYDALRPAPVGLPESISYGGPYFNLTLPRENLVHTTLDQIKVVLIRTGFSTHAMNMGQRYVQLENSYTGNADGSATLHVSQLPPNPAILAPGPALIFVVVDGVPSIGSFVMVGNGVIGTQLTSLSQSLPTRVGNNFFQTGTKGPTDSNTVGGGNLNVEDSGARVVEVGWALMAVAMAMVMF